MKNQVKRRWNVRKRHQDFSGGPVIRQGLNTCIVDPNSVSATTYQELTTAPYGRTLVTYPETGVYVTYPTLRSWRQISNTGGNHRVIPPNELPNAKFHVLCCSTDGFECFSTRKAAKDRKTGLPASGNTDSVSSEDMCYTPGQKKATFAEAAKMCASDGRRLCMKEELEHHNRQRGNGICADKYDCTGKSVHITADKDAANAFAVA